MYLLLRLMNSYDASVYIGTTTQDTMQYLHTQLLNMLPYALIQANKDLAEKNRLLKENEKRGASGS
jgi:hypothetical protein